MSGKRSVVHTRLSAGVLTLASLFLAAPAQAAPVEFRTPTQYDSVYDSPYGSWVTTPSAGSAEFYLEDFQDGQLNTPGLRIPQFDPGSPTSVVRILDNAGVGWGPDPNTPGRALSSFSIMAALSLPPIWYNSLNFEFDEAALGFLPTDFGFVWTDDNYGMHMRFSVYDREGNELGTLTGGGTGAPQLYSVRFDKGIGSVRLWTSKRQHEETELTVDHIQYGSRFVLRTTDSADAAVPEPSALALLLLGGLMMGVARRGRFTAG